MKRENIEETTLVGILRKIKIYLKKDSIDMARDLINLEKDNLKGLTEERVRIKNITAIIVVANISVI